MFVPNKHFKFVDVIDGDYHIAIDNESTITLILILHDGFLTYLTYIKLIC